MEDVRDVDGPAAQREIERRGHTHRQQRTDIVSNKVDGLIDPHQQLPQPLGAGVLRGGESIRTFGAETRQRHRNRIVIRDVAEGIPHRVRFRKPMNEDGSHARRLSRKP
jgi:hypothetical protein